MSLIVVSIENQEEIHHFAGWEGGLRGAKIVNKNYVNKLAFPRCFEVCVCRVHTKGVMQQHAS